MEGEKKKSFMWHIYANAFIFIVNAYKAFYTQIIHNLFEQMAGIFIDTPESEVILYNIKYLMSVFKLKSSCLHVTPLYH